MLHDLSPEDLLSRETISFDDGEVRRSHRRQAHHGHRRRGLDRQRDLRGRRLRAAPDELSAGRYQRERALFFVASARRAFPGFAFTPSLPISATRIACRQLGRLHIDRTTVFHAAAHKHVPLMEEAPDEAIKNNVFGTLKVARMAHDCGVERTSCSSRPTRRSLRSSVMGASKRVAELIVRAGARFEDALHRGAIRQRARLGRQRRPALQAADRARRPGHGHAPRLHALFHDHPRGRRARLHRRPRRLWRALHPRHGRADQDRRPRREHDHDGGLHPGGRNPDRLSPAFAPARSCSRSCSRTRRSRRSSFAIEFASRSRCPPEDFFSELELLETYAASSNPEDVIDVLRRVVPHYQPDRKQVVLSTPQPPRRHRASIATVVDLKNDA